MWKEFMKDEGLETMNISSLCGHMAQLTLIISQFALKPGEEDEMNKRERLEELKANPKKIRFARICKIAEAFGFQTRQGPGSHRIYYKDGVREILNIQNEDGWAKPYQVRQFIKIIEKYDLQED